MTSTRIGALVVAIVAGCGGGRTTERPGWQRLIIQVAPDGPVASLEAARDLIREKRRAGTWTGAEVQIEPGTYRLRAPFDLGPDDSGTEGFPIVYRAARPGVRIVGGPAVVPSALDDAPALARVPASARSHLVALDFRRHGITDLGTGADSVQLYSSAGPTRLARWPDEGFVKIADVSDAQRVTVRDTRGDRSGSFTYDGDRPLHWTSEPDLWLEGYWYWDWADERQRVASIDPSSRTVTLAPPLHGYGYRAGQWYYAYNALAELDAPGEWYVDRAAGTGYYWPLQNGERLEVPTVPVLVRMRDASNIGFSGLSFEVARATAIEIKGGHDVVVEHCQIRNTGGWGVRVDGGEHHRIDRCEIAYTGEGGVHLDGGDRATLRPSGHSIASSEIHHIGLWKRTYTPGVELLGVGNIAIGNEIHEGPHAAVMFAGNEHVIERNDVHDVCFESNDTGAILGGRDWTARGTRIRHNYIHGLHGFAGRGCRGVMLDDMLSGIEVRSNVFFDVPVAVLIGGGRDNHVEGNVFAACGVGVHLDARGLGWAADLVTGELRTRLEQVPYAAAPWRGRYPALAQLLADTPGAPKGNRVVGNVTWRTRLDNFDDVARPWVVIDGNVDGDPGFVDPSHEDFEIRPGAAVYRAGFLPIPTHEIGLRGRR